MNSDTERKQNLQQIGRNLSMWIIFLLQQLYATLDSCLLSMLALDHLLFMFSLWVMQDMIFQILRNCSWSDDFSLLILRACLEILEGRAKLLIYPLPKTGALYSGKVSSEGRRGHPLGQPDQFNQLWHQQSLRCYIRIIFTFPLPILNHN